MGGVSETIQTNPTWYLTLKDPGAEGCAIHQFLEWASGAHLPGVLLLGKFPGLWSQIYQEALKQPRNLPSYRPNQS